jgi:GT2 family glycosyltransferase
MISKPGVITEKKSNKSDFPVSVAVITYNSSKYLLETLQSINAQTYPEIELVISDDCSTDSTINICKNWIKENEKRFLSTKIIEVEKNTGIPANCNRAVMGSSATWVKIIAGDDILDKDCIRNFVNYVSNNPETSIVSSSIRLFFGTFSEENFGRIINTGESAFFADDISASHQYYMLLRKNFIHGPSTFIKKCIIEEVGGFDEKHKLLEDYPMFLKLTRAGHKVFGLNKITVYYRRHDNTVLRHNGNSIFSDYYLKIRSFELEYIYPNIPLPERCARNMEYTRLRLIDLLGANKDNTFGRLLTLITNFINPGRLILNNALKKSLRRQ